MLTTNLDPQGPWSLETELPVFSLARVRGEGENRQWLLYAHSPVARRTGVVVEIPGFKKVAIDVTPAGTFYLVSAAEGSVVSVLDR